MDRRQYPTRLAHAVDLGSVQKHESAYAGTAGSSNCEADEVKQKIAPVKIFGTGMTRQNSEVTSCMSSEEEAVPDDTKVTEFDRVAYSKEDVTENMHRRIMNRMFSAFDVTQTGFLDASKLKEFLEYIGRAVTTEEVMSEMQAEGGRVTFEKFWTWWQSHPSSDVRKDAFSLVSADFSVPYHQQQLKIKEEGEIFNPNYRVKYFFKDLETGYRRQVSPWHDIPLWVRDPVRTKPENIPANRYNFICEIPKWTRAKFEIATGEPFNPIKQDIKNGLPRFYKHGDMMWNYGAFPQTWESTEVIFEDGVSGDNDPIDGVEIGMRQMRVGEVHPVKVLGVLGMIDDGQMDWKVVCISVNDPVTRFIKDITDVPKFLPGCLDALREWFRVYKICQGGVENKFAFDGEFKSKEFTMKVIEESHYMWENLRKIKRKVKV